MNECCYYLLVLLVLLVLSLYCRYYHHYHYEVYYHFNNLRFNNSQNLNDVSAAHEVVCFVPSENLKCRLLKWWLDHPTTKDSYMYMYIYIYIYIYICITRGGPDVRAADAPGCFGRPRGDRPGGPPGRKHPQAAISYIYIYIYIYTYIHVYVYVHVYMIRYVMLCYVMLLYIYIYVYIYIYIYHYIDRPAGAGRAHSPARLRGGCALSGARKHHRVD